MASELTRAQMLTDLVERRPGATVRYRDYVRRMEDAEYRRLLALIDTGASDDE